MTSDHQQNILRSYCFDNKYYFILRFLLVEKPKGFKLEKEVRGYRHCAYFDFGVVVLKGVVYEVNLPSE